MQPHLVLMLVIVIVLDPLLQWGESIRITIMSRSESIMPAIESRHFPFRLAIGRALL